MLIINIKESGGNYEKYRRENCRGLKTKFKAG